MSAKKKEHIISKATTKYWERTHKYGIEIPKTVQDAMRIDREDNYTLWQDTISIEMKNVQVAFTVREGDIKDLEGYELISGHLIFDVKVGEDFRQKARYVAD